VKNKEGKAKEFFLQQGTPGDTVTELTENFLVFCFLALLLRTFLFAETNSQVMNASSQEFIE
jgi:hypothetical protein